MTYRYEPRTPLPPTKWSQLDPNVTGDFTPIAIRSDFGDCDHSVTIVAEILSDGGLFIHSVKAKSRNAS